MKKAVELFFKIGLWISVSLIWFGAYDQPVSNMMNTFMIVGCVLLVFPVVWLGRTVLDNQPTSHHATWTTIFVHYALGILFGVAVIRAIITHRDWIGWTIPIPAEIGLPLVVVSGVVGLLTVANLAIKGLGAPFAIALSEKLAVDWFYAWTRNPMVLAALALLLSLGIWFQSTLFVLWALILFTPALLVFVKVYEERELEIRFGASYVEYKSRTPMLFPRKPRN